MRELVLTTIALACVGGRFLADERWPPRRLLRFGAVAALLLLGAEAGRFFATPELTIDGQGIETHDVLAPGDHAAHTIGWR